MLCLTDMLCMITSCGTVSTPSESWTLPPGRQHARFTFIAFSKGTPWKNGRVPVQAKPSLLVVKDFDAALLSSYRYPRGGVPG